MIKRTYEKMRDLCIRNKRKMMLMMIDMVLAALSFMLLSLAHKNQAFSDWYVESVYCLFVNVFGRLFGLFKISVVEMLLYICIIFWTAWLIIVIARKLKGLFSYTVSFMTFASILFLSYTLCCGINYGHTSFSQQEHIKTENYSTENLIGLCIKLTDEVNELSKLQARDENGVAVVENIPEKSRDTMIKLGSRYERMKGFYPVPKPLVNSAFLSVQQLSGIYVPFTLEANYNKDMPDYAQTFTACHELSHLRGYMQEEEANYLAFLACDLSDYPEFRYGGYLTGLVYATNELYNRDYEKWEEISDRLSKEAFADLEANNDFWEKYEGKISEVSDEINDRYLKANGQEDGVESYDRMVDLMVSWYINK